VFEQDVLGPGGGNRPSVNITITGVGSSSMSSDTVVEEEGLIYEDNG
jgi:hypothetical protein